MSHYFKTTGVDPTAYGGVDLEKVLDWVKRCCEEANTNRHEPMVFHTDTNETYKNNIAGDAHHVGYNESNSVATVRTSDMYIVYTHDNITLSTAKEYAQHSTDAYTDETNFRRVKVSTTNWDFHSLLALIVIATLCGGDPYYMAKTDSALADGIKNVLVTEAKDGKSPEFFFN